MTTASPHRFHVPVMGTGFTIDTCLRVARYGISSVMSIVDDHLVERVRRGYARKLGRPEVAISAKEPDARARRITAWLDFCHAEVERQVAALKALPLAPGNDKHRWFALLPGGPLREKALACLALPPGGARDALERELTSAIVPGSIDVNIMTKLDLAAHGANGDTGPEHSDAKAALRGFARSRGRGSIVLSAGVNPSLFSYFAQFEDFYSQGGAPPKKTVILKVSDARSALIQGKLLAKKGVTVSELRVESGLNCGGHAFATDGELMGPILEELAARRGELQATFDALVAESYAARGATWPGREAPLRLTAQGGVGNAGEQLRLLEGYGFDSVGWATPFLLVPEVTALDDRTRAALARATADDLYVSDSSPLGVPFNNLRTSSSEAWRRARVAAGTPGSDCPKGFLAFDEKLAGKPLCTASREYQQAKLAQLGAGATEEQLRALYAKSCICDHLGNGALIALGLAKEETPVAVCPGPNVQWFDRTYTLEEMVAHVYGRGESLVPERRPHFFAAELALYVDDLERKERKAAGDPKAQKALAVYRENLARGIEHCRRLAAGPAFFGENLASLAEALEEQSARLELSQELHRAHPVHAGAAAEPAPSA